MTLATLDDDDPFGPATVAAPPPPRAKRKPSPTPAPQPAPYTGQVAFTIFGSPCSKANSRELATVGPKDNRRMIFRKSDVALAYEEQALRQIPPHFRLQLQDKLAMELRIFYASEANDLDESIVLDVMQNRYKLIEIPGKEKKERVLIQAGIYVNDRQIRERHVYHGIDKANPRSEIRIWSIEPQATLL